LLTGDGRVIASRPREIRRRDTIFLRGRGTGAAGAFRVFNLSVPRFFAAEGTFRLVLAVAFRDFAAGPWGPFALRFMKIFTSPRKN
jgi:hypothetical protein